MSLGRSGIDRTHQIFLLELKTALRLSLSLKEWKKLLKNDSTSLKIKYFGATENRNLFRWKLRHCVKSSCQGSLWPGARSSHPGCDCTEAVLGGLPAYTALALPSLGTCCPSCWMSRCREERWGQVALQLAEWPVLVGEKCIAALPCDISYFI